MLPSNESGSPWRRALERTLPALCVAVVAFLAEPTGAVVQLVRGPYLQNGTSSSIVVRWRTDSPSGSRMVYGPEPGTHTTTLWDPTPTTEHIVTVAGLEPGARYYYAVGTADEVLAGDDPDHFFFTAPAPGTRTPIRVWVVGDSGTGDGNALAVRDAYETFGTGTRTDLWLMLGDNALPAGTDLDHQVALFDIYSGMLRNSVLWPTLGDAEALNADSEAQSGPYFDVFTLPDGSSTEAYYSFDFANVHFVALDSSTSDRTPFGPMAMWLSQDLAANAADWTVAFWHHAPYSKGLYDSDVESEMIEMRENFVPILESHGVDLVLSGHSHGYERTFLINGHHADSTTFSPEMQLDSGDGSEMGDGAYTKALSGPVPGSGTVYVVAGSSGQAVSGSLDHPAAVVSLNSLGSVILDVDGDRLDLRFLDDGGVVWDAFTLLKGVDPDLDGVETGQDNCLDMPNSGQEDLDSDEFGDACDGCPEDPIKSAPGICGCGTSDGDTDGDGIAECIDNCPGMPNPAQADFNADGSGDACTDADGDGALDESDCAPLASGVSALPGEIGPTLTIEDTGGGTLAWKRGFQGHGTHVYRGSILVGQNPVPTMTCIEADIPGEQAIDPEIPPVGSAFAYLVRAVNVCGASGVGEYGPLGGPRAAPASCAGANEDDDLDTIASLLDNCPTVPNADQSDVDGDFVGDSCDNCPTTSNPDQTDSDDNGGGDACAALPDADGDGIEDSSDNCVGAFNTTQLDADGDGTGDACDACPDESAKVDPGICGCSVPDEDRDADGSADCVDPCPDDPDNDLDGDGVCENTDFCPSDPGKSAPGVCGCGIADEDTDGDGTPDCIDLCPEDPAKVDPGACGCGLADVDSDGDGTLDCGDPCPSDPAKVGPGVCGCGVPDVDTDSDGVLDCDDPCPSDPAKAAPGICGCGVSDDDSDADGTADCIDQCPNEPDIDTDGDATADCIDPCAADPSKIDPGVCGCGTPDIDTDTDGIADCLDVCPGDPDDDLDGDGRCADVDNCPGTSNPGQEDGDVDQIGDACDPCPTDPDNDLDGDGACFDTDLCPLDPGKTEPGSCGCGVADIDTDADGTLDCDDPCPADPLKVDAGLCGCGIADDDSDGDGTADCEDACSADPAKIDPGVCGCGVVDQDSDGDETADCIDPCPDDPGNDPDGDGVCDDIDLCPADPAKSGPGLCGCGVADEDRDGDGTTDCIDPCPDDPGDDLDGDGRCADADNCPESTNPGQEDGDLDQIGDACDPCPADPGNDVDGDGVCGDVDLCPADPAKSDPGLCGCGIVDLDTDGDGALDCMEACPSDPTKIDVGSCGCGVAEIDADGDLTPDCIDTCPTDANKIDPGVCGCGTPDTDSDSDGAADCIDTCPNDPADDLDGDGLCADADLCPADPRKSDPGVCGCGVADHDTDGDGSLDCDDHCPTNPLKVVSGLCGCGLADEDGDNDAIVDCLDFCDQDPDNDLDGDGVCGDVDSCPVDPGKSEPGVCGCGVPDFDTDGDGALDCNDPCFADPAKVEPGICGCGVADDDGDADGTADCNDPCPNDPDNDLDGDGVCGDVDLCPADPDKSDPGVCGCGAADDDGDGDGTFDCDDPCASDPAKVDPGDCGCGAPDIDTDGDGAADCIDLCPFDPGKIVPGVCGCDTADSDTDGDGAPDCIDADADNDGVPELETEALAPDALLDQTGLAGLVEDIDDPPDLPDGNWLVATESNIDVSSRLSFPAPSRAPGRGFDQQQFRVQVRQFAEQAGTPRARLELWENGALLRAGPDVDIAGVGQVLSFRWDATELANPDGTDVECVVVGVSIDVPPEESNTVDVGAVVWNVYLDSDPSPLDPDRCGDRDGDSCDDCSEGLDGFGPLADNDPLDDGEDSDGDGWCDRGDYCPLDPAKIVPGLCGCGEPDSITDTDGDGTADCVDLCPADPDKSDPGECGCGAPEDDDFDEEPDCVEGCPLDHDKAEPGICGCGVADDDIDADGILDCDDNCPTASNLDQVDTDGNGIGDPCDIGGTFSGTISLAWDPIVDDPDLIGYRVYVGTTSGVYDRILSVSQAAVTVPGLPTCADYFLAVKARGISGIESVEFSNEVSGWPRPVILSVDPPTLPSESETDVTVSGMNFQSGARVEFADPEITVVSTTSNGCGEIAVRVSVPPGASPGARDFAVLNPDDAFALASGMISVGE